MFVSVFSLGDCIQQKSNKKLLKSNTWKLHARKTEIFIIIIFPNKDVNRAWLSLNGEQIEPVNLVEHVELFKLVKLVKYGWTSLTG